MYGCFLLLLVLAMSGLSLAAAGAPVPLLAVQAVAGSPPEGCKPALTGGGGPVQWIAVADAEAPRGLALAETSADRTNNRFPLCILPVGAARNLDVTVRFRPVAGRVDQAGGIAVRFADAKTYYVVRANALEDNVRLYHVTDGVRREFAGRDTKVASGQWHTLRLRLVGDRFEVWFNGDALFTATDRRITGAGQIALWTKADSLTHFAELSVEPLP
jgi:hypothetical protein